MSWSLSIVVFNCYGATSILILILTSSLAYVKKELSIVLVLCFAKVETFLELLGPILLARAF